MLLPPQRIFLFLLSPNSRQGGSSLPFCVKSRCRACRADVAAAKHAAVLSSAKRAPDLDTSKASQTYGTGARLETLPTSTSTADEALPAVEALPAAEAVPAAEALPASASTLRIEDVKGAVKVLVDHALPLAKHRANEASEDYTPR